MLFFVVSFESFAIEHGPRLRAGLVAAYGPDVGLDAAAESMAYGFEHWQRLSTMGNPSVDPEAQLYVLPTDSDSVEFSNGESSTARPDSGDSVAPKGPVIVIGTEADGGFSNLVTVMVLDKLPDAMGNAEWTEVDTPSGPAS